MHVRRQVQRQDGLAAHREGPLPDPVRRHRDKAQPPQTAKGDQTHRAQKVGGAQGLAQHGKPHHRHQRQRDRDEEVPDPPRPRRRRPFKHTDQARQPISPAPQQTQRQHRIEQDQRRIADQRPDRRRVGHAQGNLAPDHQSRLGKRVPARRPVGRVQRAWPQLQQLVRLPDALGLVDLRNQPVGAAIGLVGGNARGLQPRQLIGQRQPPLGNIVRLAYPRARRRTQRINLLAQRVDARLVGVFRAQKGLPPIGQLAAQPVQPGRIHRIRMGQHGFGMAGHRLPGREIQRARGGLGLADGRQRGRLAQRQPGVGIGFNDRRLGPQDRAAFVGRDTSALRACTGRRDRRIGPDRHPRHQRQQQRRHGSQSLSGHPRSAAAGLCRHASSNTVGRPRGARSSQSGTGRPFSFRKVGLNSLD